MLSASFAKESTSPTSKETYDIVQLKQNHVAKYEHLYQPNMTEEAKAKRVEQLENLLNEMVANGYSLNKIESELEKVQAFVLHTPDSDVLYPSENEIQNIGILAADRNDINMVKPLLTYDAQTGNWVVTGGGHWKNNEWVDHAPTLWGFPGETKNVGGENAVGIVYFNTSGPAPVTVSGGRGLATDHDGWMYTVTNPSVGDGSKGVAYKFQDKVQYKSDGLTYYLGRGMSASITYNSTFTNFHGHARSFAVHTWDKAIIDSISFGVSGKTFGLDVSVTNAQFSWSDLHNDADLVF